MFESQPGSVPFFIAAVVWGWVGRRFFRLHRRSRQESEQRLRQSQEGLAFALQSAKMGTWEIDLKDQRLVCSAEMLELWGISSAAFEGQRLSLQSKVHPQDRERMIDAIDQAIAQGTIYELEYRIHPQPGQERWVLSRGRCTYDADLERPVRFTGVVYDITERKLRDLKNAFLLKSVTAFSKAFTPGEVLDTCVSLCDETFTACSGSLALADAEGRTLLWISPEENDGVALGVFARAEPLFLKASAYIPIRYQERVTGVLGIRFAAENHWSDVSEKAFLALGELVGQTLERNQLHEQTHLERDHYRTFFALSSNGSAEVDARTLTLLRVNERFLEIVGSTSNEILEKDFLGLILPVDQPRIRQALAANAAWRAEVGLLRRDGSHAWVIFSGNVVRDAKGAPAFHLIATLDISDRKENEEALRRAVRARDQFLSIASHELRTPLTSLQLQIQLRQREMARNAPNALSPERIVASLNEAERQAQRIELVVNDIFDVSRFAEGRLRLKRTTFDLGALVQAVVERFQGAAEAVGVTLELGPCASICGAWDQARLEQVIFHLLTNALRYGRKKPVHVALTEASGRGVLVVRDAGIGIKPEDQRRVFERYERAVSENEVSGLGLGLFIAQEIVLAHGGEICLTSEEGKGSEFCVLLPIPSGEGV